MPRSSSSKIAIKRFAGRMAGQYIRLVKSTSRVIQDPPDPHELLHQEYPYILAMWHGQFLLLPPFSPKDLPISNMVARHGDAELIAEALKTFDMGLVRGGGAAGRRRDRGGATAFREALQLLEGGRSVAMTADVPPGPARKAGLGIVKLAAKSGRPIIPVATASSRFWALDTWSRMTINLPFSKVSATHGQPIRVARDADDAALERARQAVEDGLNETTARAYQLVSADLDRATPESAKPSDAPPARADWRLKTYRLATRAAEPLLPLALNYRARKGKEDPSRRPERLGHASRPRPNGELIWLHAASVGETNAVLPLIDALCRRRPDLNVLLTTGTVTSAKVAAERLKPPAFHQYAPLDAPASIERFLTHWQPRLVILTESEIWPNMIMRCHELGFPVVLANARMSERSFKRWRKNKAMARPLFSRLRVVLAQNERLARWFRQLGARDSRATGNLKVDAPPLPVDSGELDRLKLQIGDRPVLLAASVHPGEFAALIDALGKLKPALPELLLIVAPRHPERGPEIAAALDEAGYRHALRAAGETITAETDAYIANTVGEMGLFYSLSKLTFMGGTLIEHGGQNPIEAIRFGTVLLAGPSRYNFTDTFRELNSRDGLISVNSADGIAEAAARLFSDDIECARLRESAAAALASMEGALDATLGAILKLLPAPGEDMQRAS